jgi:hypothetical protein
MTPIDLYHEIKRFEATLRNDAAALDSCLHSSFFFIHSSGRLDDKNSYLALLTSGTLIYRNMHWQEMRIATQVENTAQIFSRLRFSAEYSHNEVQVSAYILTTWIWQGGNWLALSCQSTAAPPP